MTNSVMSQKMQTKNQNVHSRGCCGS